MFDSIQKGLTYMGFISKLFGTRSEREIKKFSAQVEQVMALEDSYRQLSDEDLKAKTQVFKDRLAQGATLDDILPEAFAACREACRICCGEKWNFAASSSAVTSGARRLSRRWVRNSSSRSLSVSGGSSKSTVSCCTRARTGRRESRNNRSFPVSMPQSTSTICCGAAIRSPASFSLSRW